MASPGPPLRLGLPLVLSALLIFAVSPGLANHAQTEAGRSVAFDHVVGNEWWVEVAIAGPDAAAVASVDAMDTNGAWTPLAKKSWGPYAASFHIEPGHLVSFRANFASGGPVLSCPFTHPAGAEQCPATPPIGTVGPPGPAGPQGPQGPQGPAGPAGANGTDGAAGQDGADGVDGINGTDGADGQDGADGTNGTNGADGQDGADGAAGAPGLNGTDGADGQDGADGAPGVNGTNGQDGATGATGATGAPGAPGAPGPTGPTGATGPAGPAGSTRVVGATQQVSASTQYTTAAGSASCPAGKVVLGGGAQVVTSSTARAVLVYSYPDSTTGWIASALVIVAGNPASTASITVYALCSL